MGENGLVGDGKNVYCQRRQADADIVELISLNRRKGHIQSQEQVNTGEKKDRAVSFS